MVAGVQVRNRVEVVQIRVRVKVRVKICCIDTIVLSVPGSTGSCTRTSSSGTLGSRNYIVDKV
jgi:hypothetical protein